MAAKSEHHPAAVTADAAVVLGEATDLRLAVQHGAHGRGDRGRVAGPRGRDTQLEDCPTPGVPGHRGATVIRGPVQIGELLGEPHMRIPQSRASIVVIASRQVYDATSPLTIRRSVDRYGKRPDDRPCGSTKTDRASSSYAPQSVSMECMQFNPTTAWPGRTCDTLNGQSGPSSSCVRAAEARKSAIIDEPSRNRVG